MKTELTDPRSASYQRGDDFQQRLNNHTVLEGECAELDFSVAIIVGRWHAFIVDRLLSGALDAIAESGIAEKQVDIVYAPGSYEIPLVTKKIAERNHYKAIVTLGAIIRGDTPHFDFVAGECARGISDVALEYDVPIGFGVLTVNNVDQALARAEHGEANKGREAALAALETANLIAKLNQG